RAPGLAEPGTHIPGAVREGPVEHRRMPEDASPRGVVPRQDEQPRDVLRLPAEAFPRDRWRQSDLFIELAQGCLDRDELGLNLHNDEVPSRGRPSEEVDRPALAIARVRQL